MALPKNSDLEGGERKKEEKTKNFLSFKFFQQLKRSKPCQCLWGQGDGKGINF